MIGFAYIKPRLVLAFIAVALFGGCSSSVTKQSSTTIDPSAAKIEELQEQLEELKTQVNATTIPTTTTTTTTTVAPKSTTVTGYGSYTSNARGQSPNRQYYCEEYVKYSDGTADITKKYWITEDMFKANGGCP